LRRRSPPPRRRAADATDKPAIRRVRQTGSRGARPPPARRPSPGGAPCAVLGASSPCSVLFSSVLSLSPPRNPGQSTRRTSARAGPLPLGPGTPASRRRSSPSDGP